MHCQARSVRPYKGMPWERRRGRPPGRTLPPRGRRAEKKDRLGRRSGGLIGVYDVVLNHIVQALFEAFAQDADLDDGEQVRQPLQLY